FFTSMSRNSVLTDEQSRINARLEAHMVYICPECGKAFRTQAEWRQHLNTKHDYLTKTYADFNFIQIDENFHECQLCFKWVENAHKTIALLQYHYFMHLDHRETYRCVHCRLAYTRRRALNEHLLSTHMKEIEKYEAKLKQVKRTQEEQKKLTKVKVTRQRNDLLQKALMDIDLQTEDPESQMVQQPPPVKANANAKGNASEQALDRCLNAYEDFVRKEEEGQSLKQEIKYESESDALCEEFFEEQRDVTERSTKPSSATDKEVVIIEIDALGEEEMDQLKKDMKSESETETDPSATPPKKRQRLAAAGNPEADMEHSSDDLLKLISYLCPKCGKEIASMDDWRKHVFKKHDFEHFIEHSFKIKDQLSMCLQCQEVLHTTKRAELQKHCFKHLPYRSYLKCSLCQRTKTSMSKMYNHIRYNHQAELQRKNKTQLLIKPEPKWTQHTVKKREIANIAETDEERLCKYCGKSFKTFWRFERHASLCKAPGAPNNAADLSADALFKHLREGRARINAIWSKMQLGAL
ncbi:hypothetical protein KR222_001297, partial [Zaprionus bogoriensis]